jgi:hypothetical protein
MKKTVLDKNERYMRKLQIAEQREMQLNKE